MVMERSRTDIDHQIDSQGGSGHQGAAQRKSHLAIGQQWEPFSSSCERNPEPVGITNLYQDS
jgi:hypothetical protein